jgi:anti-sigma factor RsiW
MDGGIEMNCERLRELSSEYVDGRLAARRARKVEAHLQACAGCRAAVRDFETMKAWLARTEPPAAEAAFWDRALARVRGATSAERAPRRPTIGYLLGWQRAVAWSTAAAAVALGIIAPLRVHQWQQPGSTQHVIGWHAGYVSRQPLSDQGQMQMVAMHASFADTD